MTTIMRKTRNVIIMVANKIDDKCGLHIFVFPHYIHIVLLAAYMLVVEFVAPTALFGLLSR